VLDEVVDCRLYWCLKSPAIAWVASPQPLHAGPNPPPPEHVSSMRVLIFLHGATAEPLFACPSQPALTWASPW